MEYQKNNNQSSKFRLDGSPTERRPVLIAECGELQRTKTIQFETANALHKERTTKITNKGVGVKMMGRATTAQISMAKETMSTWQLTLHVKQDKY
jgi:hypothetical protein